jgi:hypothetical protein
MNQRLFTALSKSIERAAAPGEVWYTRQQLYYEVCRTLRPVPGLRLAPALLTFAVGLLPALAALGRPGRAVWTAAASGGVAGMLWALRTLPYTLPTPISYATFDAAFTAWCSRAGPPARLLPPPQPITLAQHQPEGGTGAGTEAEYDRFHYGLSRLLICQHEETAHMLLANRFHMEMKCAVLGLAEGVPVPPVLRTMLTRSSDTQARIFFLHDASIEGMALAASLRERLDIPDTLRVVDIGLRPTHAMRLHLFARRTLPTKRTEPAAFSSPSHSFLSSLSSGEGAWLQRGWSAEVAAVVPAELVLKLRRIVTGEALPPRSLLTDLRRDRSTGFMSWPAP